jgi:hypothetical protein
MSQSINLLYNNKFQDTSDKSAQKIYNVESFIDYFVQNKNHTNAILIVPTQKYVNRVKKEYYKMNFAINASPTPQLNFFRLQDFAENCYKYLFPKSAYKRLSDSAILSLMEEAMQRTNLKYYENGNKISPNVLQRISQVILGLKEDGIMPESMERDLEVLQNIVSAELRFNDIMNIYSNYEKLLGDKYLDLPTIYRQLSLALDAESNNNFILDDYFQQIIGKNNSISEAILMFYGFSEFKLPEAGFISKFEKSNIPTIVNIDYSPISGPNIKSLPDFIRRLVVGNNLLKNAASGLNDQLYISHLNDTNDISNEPSHHIRKWLYNELNTLYLTELKQQIQIIQSTDRIDEVKNLAKLVKYLVLKKDLEYSDICICSRNPSLYSNIFREFFSESGIVVNISDRFPLINASPVVLIFAILDIISNWYKRIDIERIILFPEVLDKIPDIGVFIDVAKKYRMIGGIRSNEFQYWEKTLNQYLYFAQNRLANNQTQEDIREITSDIKELEKALLVLKQLKLFFNFKNKKYSINEFVEIIKNEIIQKFIIA